MSTATNLNLNFYDVLKNSYKPTSSAFSKQGYIYDKDLSNHNQQVYYNPKDKKMVLSVAGTHNLKDWGTNAYLATGQLKKTKRYKEAQNTLSKAKQKYQPANTTVAGHSLGGSIGQYIAGGNDKVYTLDKGATIGQKTRANETAFRHSNDLVSLFSATNSRMHTFGIPKVPTVRNALEAHRVDRIKDKNIFI